VIAVPARRVPLQREAAGHSQLRLQAIPALCHRSAQVPPLGAGAGFCWGRLLLGPPPAAKLGMGRGDPGPLPPPTRGKIANKLSRITV
jgi:hypothetical protein